MRRYPPELRARAVGMVLEDGRTVKAVAAELGIVASTLSRWVNQARERQREQGWAGQVEPAFGFLQDYGFEPVRVRAHDWWEVAAVYRAEHAALEVVWSNEFQRVEVRLLRARLLDLPGDPVMIAGVPGLHGHLADRLLERTNRDRRARQKLLGRYAGLSAETITAALFFWAEVLREHAASFLRGDLSILDGWEQPGRPTVVVSLPRRATPSDEARAVARTRAVFPDAEITVKRYPLPPDEIAALLSPAGS